MAMTTLTGIHIESNRPKREPKERVGLNIPPAQLGRETQDRHSSVSWSDLEQFAAATAQARILPGSRESSHSFWSARASRPSLLSGESRLWRDVVPSGPRTPDPSLGGLLISLTERGEETRTARSRP